MRLYRVYYIIKVEGSHRMYYIETYAPSEGQAKARVKDYVFDETGWLACSLTCYPKNRGDVVEAATKGLPPCKWRS